MLNSNVILGEILNPQIYTGITERDFHLYNLDKDRMPNYVHIEPDSKPKCTCIMYAIKFEHREVETCEHISFVIKSILELKENESMTYNEEQLKKAFESAEKKNKEIIRETYGITKRKNFKFPNPKKYKYEYDDYDEEHQIHEWRIKERLYSRGIVAQEFHGSDDEYSYDENLFDEYFTSEKEAKPTRIVFEEPKLKGKQLKLHKKFIEEENVEI